MVRGQRGQYVLKNQRLLGLSERRSATSVSPSLPSSPSGELGASVRLISSRPCGPDPPDAAAAWRERPWRNRRRPPLQGRGSRQHAIDDSLDDSAAAVGQVLVDPCRQLAFGDAREMVECLAAELRIRPDFSARRHQILGSATAKVNLIDRSSHGQPSNRSLPTLVFVAQCGPLSRGLLLKRIGGPYSVVEFRCDPRLCRRFGQQIENPVSVMSLAVLRLRSEVLGRGY